MSRLDSFIARMQAQRDCLNFLKPAIDAVLPMAQVREAYTRMGSRQVMGKVVLVNEV